MAWNRYEVEQWLAAHRRGLHIANIEQRFQKEIRIRMDFDRDHSPLDRLNP